MNRWRWSLSAPGRWELYDGERRVGAVFLVFDLWYPVVDGPGNYRGRRGSDLHTAASVVEAVVSAPAPYSINRAALCAGTRALG